MSTVRCARCGGRLNDGTSGILDVTIYARKFPTKDPCKVSSHDDYLLCEKCLPVVKQQLDELQDVIEATMLGQTYVFPFRLPAVGESIFEVIDGKHPIVESVITKFENGRYEATAENITDAGNITFTPFDIGVNLFLTKKEAQAEKKRRTAEENH